MGHAASLASSPGFDMQHVPTIDRETFARAGVWMELGCLQGLSQLWEERKPSVAIDKNPATTADGWGSGMAE